MRPESDPTASKSRGMPVSLKGAMDRMCPNTWCVRMTSRWPVDDGRSSWMTESLDTMSSWALGPEKFPYTAIWGGKGGERVRDDLQ